MTIRYYMIKLSGWKKLESKFNAVVATSAWQEIASNFQRDTLWNNANLELVKKCDAGKFFLIKFKNSDEKRLQITVNELVTSIHELIGLSARQALSIEVFHASDPDCKFGLSRILSRMRPRNYTLVKKSADVGLKQILVDESIQSYLQPIFNLHTDEVAGYELLTRGPDHSPLFGADKLFGAAQNLGLSYELEYLCIKKGIMLLDKIAQNKFLTVNINPNFLNQRTLFELIASANSNPQLKLELTEHLPVEDWSTLRHEMLKYGSLNIDFWLDDAGCGYFGLETIEEVKPSVVKLCVNLIRHIETDATLLPQLRRVVKKVHDMGSLILAEGVETAQQDEVLRALDVDLVQGYYYAKPQGSDLVLLTQREANISPDSELV